MLLPLLLLLVVGMISCYHLRSTVVLLVTAFHVFVAADVAALVAAVDMFAAVFIFFSSGDSTVTVTALHSGRSSDSSPHYIPQASWTP